MTSDDLPGTTQVARDPIDLAGRAAAWLVESCRGLDTFTIALSGGSTPRFLYEALATSAFRNRVDWSRWQVYFSDERAVSPDDADSNYRLARDALLAKVAVPASQVHRMEAERGDLDAAAGEYSGLLAVNGEPPRLDVVLLGLGEDGHTASLFPGTPALLVDDAWAARGQAPKPPHDRMTMTLPAINAARRVAFLVTGRSKADALRSVVAGTVPAGEVRPQSRGLVWFLDAAAAASIG